MSPRSGFSTIAVSTKCSRIANASNPTRASSQGKRRAAAELPSPSTGMSVDPQLLQLVPERAERDPQRRGRLRLVVPVVLERLLDRVAFDLFDVARQRAGHAVARV